MFVFVDSVGVPGLNLQVDTISKSFSTTLVSSSNICGGIGLDEVSYINSNFTHSAQNILFKISTG